MLSRWSISLVVLSFVACQRSQGLPLEAAKVAQAAPEAARPVEPAHAQPPRDSRAAPEVAKVKPLPVCQPGGLEPLSAARKAYDEGRFEEGLSCAAEAAALRPDSAQAHSERGAALAALGRFEEAQVAYARALALDPDHEDALLGAAHLYIVGLPSTRERDELGSVYAEHGLAVAEELGDTRQVAEFALLSAMAYNDLGQSRDALTRAEQALKGDPKNRDAQYERATALFELCRFEDAKAAFTALLEDKERGAHAHYHLGLLLEREGRFAEAEKHFARARTLSPDDFPSPQLLSETEFKAEVEKAVAALPEDMRRDLKGIPVAAEDVPKDDDLMSGDPPLSPSILGLFRGPPLNESCTPDDGVPCRSVALYRRNLARAVRSRGELLEQIRVTLLHEVGHLRGEDDTELAARGLE